MNKRRWTIAIAVAVLAAGAGVWRWTAANGKARPAFETAAVDKGNITAKVTATGTLSAIVTVQVGSQVSGRIAELRADFNSTVKKGQLIAKIDPALFQAAVEQARANHMAAQGNLARSQAQATDADRQAARAKALAERKLIALADYETAQSTADAARAQVAASQGAVEQARAALHQAQVNLAYTDIVSPTNGVVISRNVDVGQTVAASLQAPTLFVIAEDLAKMQVDTSVAEADVGRLRAGMEASFTVDAYPSERFQGKVRQIRNAPQTVQNVVTYDAVIDVDNPALKLKPGMTANVTFIYAEKDDVVRIPNAALRFRPPPDLLKGSGGAGAARAGGNARAPREGETRDRRTLWVLREAGPAPVRVRTGISDGSTTELVEGELQPGDKVITDAAGGSTNPMAAQIRRGL
ncbi:MAG: efflux RND transporter periplasmic adaptor subunit [Deltaproteobacteria bacterium]|nr:efflux RND transporter periplasmic adaptor subunit [Deltaproteobacteria bacterium]